MRVGVILLRSCRFDVGGGRRGWVRHWRFSTEEMGPRALVGVGALLDRLIQRGG